MSKYTFTFKKDNIFVDFSTTDRELVERQFQIWVTAADIYAKSRRRKASAEKTNHQPSANEEKFSESKQQESQFQVEQQPNTEVSEAKPEVFDKASAMLRTINTIQEGEKPSDSDVISPAFTPAEEARNVPATPAEEVVKEEETPIQTEEAKGFEEVLEQSIENPTFEPVKSQDPVFLNLVKSKNTTDRFHYLMITAYYLSEFEKMERFSLKQINAKLMQNLSEVLDHATLQAAINQSLIELVPDLTGTSEIGEYRITRAGEEFFTHQI